MASNRIENRLAFACGVSQISLGSQRSCFRGTSSCNLRTKSISLIRTNSPSRQRARFFALGASPPPPPPADKEGESGDASEEGDGSEDATNDAQEKSQGSEEVTADDILNSPSFLKKKLELVQKELIELKSEADEAEEILNEEKQRYVRLAADFENYRRRSVEDVRQQDAKSTAKVCKEILSVLDNFERATKAVEPSNEAEEKIVNSFQSINKQLLDGLIKLKVEPIDAVGAVFDPQLHEAIQRLESNEYAEDVVCQQYSRGYQIGETLIRAAVVGVSAGPGPADGEGSPANDDGEAVPEASKNGNENVKEEVQQAADGL